jgi:N-acetyl-anhydromuramyl-L-alanine amidase AmpD
MIDTTTFAAKASHRREHIYPKTQICLHFTAGSSARGCYAAFQRNKNGTAFILDRDGKIYQYFDPRFWNVHLYRHKRYEPAGYYDLEKAAVGIEIVNLGPLKKDGDILRTYYGGKYCDVEDVELYWDEGKPWKGYQYWQNYTFAQYSSLNWLLNELEDQFAIPRVSDPLEPAPNDKSGGARRIAKWHLDELLSYKGITTHANYRNDKFDVGPAFQWQLIHTQV